MLSRSIRTLLLLALFCLSLTSVAFSGDENKDVKPKDLYKVHCKVCHDVDSPAEEYTPISLIQEQWQEFFGESYSSTHDQLSWPEDEAKILSEIITPEMLKKIEKFCVDHAADSEQPMTCG